MSKIRYDAPDTVFAALPLNTDIDVHAVYHNPVSLVPERVRLNNNKEIEGQALTHVIEADEESSYVIEKQHPRRSHIVGLGATGGIASNGATTTIAAVGIDLTTFDAIVAGVFGEIAALTNTILVGAAEWAKSFKLDGTTPAVLTADGQTYIVVLVCVNVAGVPTIFAVFGDEAVDSAELTPSEVQVQAALLAADVTDMDLSGGVINAGFVFQEFKIQRTAVDTMVLTHLDPASVDALRGQRLTGFGDGVIAEGRVSVGATNTVAAYGFDVGAVDVVVDGVLGEMAALSNSVYLGAGQSVTSYEIDGTPGVLLTADGQTYDAALVAININGTVEYRVVFGAEAADGSELEPTIAQIRASLIAADITNHIQGAVLVVGRWKVQRTAVDTMVNTYADPHGDRGLREERLVSKTPKSHDGITGDAGATQTIAIYGLNVSPANLLVGGVLGEMLELTNAIFIGAGQSLLSYEIDGTAGLVITADGLEYQAALVAINVSGTIVYRIVLGAEAATGASVVPTAAQIRASLIAAAIAGHVDGSMLVVGRFTIVRTAVDTMSYVHLNPDTNAALRTERLVGNLFG